MGEVDLYTVPADRVAVIHCVTCYHNSDPGGDTILKIANTGSVVWHHNFASSLAGPEWADFEGRIVLQPGETLSAHSDSAVDLYVGGYLLSAV